MFIGRLEELNPLNALYQEKGGQLVVLYGRRRIGKTELLRQFCKGKPHIFYSAREIADAEQLAAFSGARLASGMEAAQYLHTFSDWHTAFSAISSIPTQQKRLIVLDEFPYMAQTNRSILSTLQQLWDSLLKDDDVMLILCGRSLSFIEEQLLGSTTPLFGRTRAIIKLLPLSFSDASRFFERYSLRDTIASYAILGGIPHYLKQFDDGQPLRANIEQRILQRFSPLYNEAEFMLKQSLREVATYNSIIQAVALGRTKLNEIHEATQLEKSKLSAYLHNLIELGVLYREVPITEERSQRGLYRLKDEFFRFYYAFVFPYLSELEQGGGPIIWETVIQPQLSSFIAPTFENICTEYLRSLNRSGALPVALTKIGRWWDAHHEIDILGFDAQRTHYIVGECKGQVTAMNTHDIQHTVASFSPKEKEARLHHWLFSLSGFTPQAVEMAKTEGYTLVDSKTINTWLQR